MGKMHLMQRKLMMSHKVIPNSNFYTRFYNLKLVVEEDQNQDAGYDFTQQDDFGFTNSNFDQPQVNAEDFNAVTSNIFLIWIVIMHLHQMRAKNKIHMMNSMPTISQKEIELI